jgi:DMSO reductase anchor subunit
LWFKVVNGLLLLVSLILGMVTFLSVLNILAAIGSLIVVKTMDSTFQQTYTMVTIRNVWMLCGGGLLVMFIIGSAEYHSKRLDKPGTRRLLLRTLAVEAVISIIGIGLML